MTVEQLAPGPGRPAGRRFGTLVHAVLAAVPLDAASDDVQALASVQARLLGAPAAEADAAAQLAGDVLGHPLVQRARDLARAGRPCQVVLF